MSRQIIFTPNAAQPPATYSQAVRAAGLILFQARLRMIQRGGLSRRDHSGADAPMFKKHRGHFGIRWQLARQGCKRHGRAS